jgi:uncharacterized protein YecA (UPF0149 family)
MGAFGDAISRFAQPLIDMTDDSSEQVERALAVSTLCWNLAPMTSDEQRAQLLVDVQPRLKMDDDEFDEFVSDMVLPMIRRHEEMFPAMHSVGATNHSIDSMQQTTQAPQVQRPAKPYAGTGRNERCPCGSGKKYKVCCGR